MANDEQTDTTNRVPLSAKLDPDVFGIVSKMAVDEDRSLSNMIERLLKESPRVKAELEAVEVVGAGA